MAETYQGNDFDYTGLHAFVFIDAVDPAATSPTWSRTSAASRAASSPTGECCSRR